MKKIWMTALMLSSASAMASEALVERAVSEHNYDLAFATARADVKDGKASDYTRMILAQLYLDANGTPRNLGESEKLLRPLAKKGVGEAQFLLAKTLMARSADALKGKDGELDRDKLSAYAKRPASQRKVETEASMWTYRAAEQGVEPALKVLVAELGSVVNGLDAETRAQWFEKAGKPEWAKAARQGDSYTTFKQRREVLERPEVQGVIQEQMLAAQCSDENAKVTALRVVAEPAATGFVQFKAAKPVRYTLVSGQWREVWTTSACGKHYGVELGFSADGLGGAMLQSIAPAKVDAPAAESASAPAVSS
ncbi:hypothetical protein ACTSKR_03565 [Chitinibacteraceae bacterium HSL-7]